MLCTTSPIRIVTFRNIFSIIKSNVTLLRTLYIVHMSTLMLLNFSTFLHRWASDSFVQCCAQLHQFVSLPFEKNVSIIKSNVTILRTLNIVQCCIVKLSNFSTLSIDEHVTVLCNFVHNLTYSRPYLPKQCINHKI